MPDSIARLASAAWVDRGEQIGVVSPAEKCRHEGHIDALGFQTVEDRCPPAGGIEVRIERGYDEAPIAQPVRGRTFGDGRNDFNHRVGVGSEYRHIRHHHYFETRVNGLSSLEHEVQTTIGVGHLTEPHDIEDKPRDASGNGGAHLMLHIQLRPIGIGACVDAQGSLAKVTSFADPLVRFSVLVEVIGVVVIDVGRLVVD